MPQLGGFSAQGKKLKRALELVDDAKAMVDAGCFSIMCEVTTSEVAEYLAETLPVPVISLGAGNRTHGVHIISSDLFRLWEEHVPRHSRVYVDLIPIMEDVLTRYMNDVRSRSYPGPEETVFMAQEDALEFAKTVKWEKKIDEIRSDVKKPG
jgi:3-methyl-2-oxobutanoate hydroxymethyltransferase